MANINRQVRRIISVGCLHGMYSCRKAQEAVLSFTERYKADVRLDLGDLHDHPAFRTGAKGTKDESVSVQLDYNSGVEWLRKFRPTHRCKGNHDWRIDKLTDHPNAIVAHAATSVLERLREEDERNKTIVRPYHMRDGWFTFGGTRFGHGFMYNVQAIRDHAETFGDCVIAHLHRTGIEWGRHIDRPRCICVGTMADPDALEYAMHRRNTLTWGHGAVYGEFTDKWADLHLVSAACTHGKGSERWPFPL